MDLVSIAADLGEACRTAGLIHVTEWMPGSINPPALLIPLPEIDYTLTFGRGFHQVNWTLLAFTAQAVGIEGQRQMAVLAGEGEGSVKSALEGYRSSGDPVPGADYGVTDLLVTSFRPTGAEEIAAYGMFGGAFSVRTHVQED